MTTKIRELKFGEPQAVVGGRRYVIALANRYPQAGWAVEEVRGVNSGQMRRE